MCVCLSLLFSIPQNIMLGLLHPKLHNINPYNVTHSLISQNPRERMFIVQTSLLIVTFFSLVAQNLSLMKTTKEVNPHPHIAPRVDMWSAPSSSSL